MAHGGPHDNREHERRQRLQLNDIRNAHGHGAGTEDEIKGGAQILGQLGPKQGARDAAENNGGNVDDNARREVSWHSDSILLENKKAWAPRMQGTAIARPRPYNVILLVDKPGHPMGGVNVFELRTLEAVLLIVGYGTVKNGLARNTVVTN